MIPIRDDKPSGTFPIITILLIGANVAVFVHELKLGPRGLAAAVERFGIVPARATELLTAVPPQLQRLGLPFLASMFLHGGLLHLIGNVWYLWLFGDNIEDRLGHFRYLIFYLLCGIVAGIVHVAVNPHSQVPCIGASGAIAGVLGAYFFCYPGARVLTLVPIFIFITFVRLPAFLLLGLWFAIQVMSGTGPGVDAGGVAWWAHIGGFIAGIVLVILMPQSRQSRQERRPTRYQTFRQRRHRD
jgi:membrane associated rhomboid family serine protease